MLHSTFYCLLVATRLCSNLGWAEPNCYHVNEDSRLCPEFSTFSFDFNMYTTLESIGPVCIPNLDDPVKRIEHDFMKLTCAYLRVYQGFFWNTQEKRYHCPLNENIPVDRTIMSHMSPQVDLTLLYVVSRILVSMKHKPYLRCELLGSLVRKWELAEAASWSQLWRSSPWLP